MPIAASSSATAPKLTSTSAVKRRLATDVSTWASIDENSAGTFGSSAASVCLSAVTTAAGSADAEVRTAVVTK